MRLDARCGLAPSDTNWRLALFLLCAVCLCSPGSVLGQEPVLSSLQLDRMANGRATVATDFVFDRSLQNTQQVNLKGTVALDTKLLVHLLLASNADIQRSRMQLDIAGHLRDAEAALYESVLFGNARQEGRERQRSIVERQSNLVTSTATVLDEHVTSLELGARNRLPTGGEISLSYKLRDTRNNLILASARRDGEYDGALSFTLKQPLLRGSGRDVIETDRRVAEIEEKISFFQYKQQILKVCSDALSIYWQLYRANEISVIRQLALDNARQILRTTVSRVEAGRIPASNIVEASAATTIRDVERIRAEQGVREAESRLLSLLNISYRSNPTLRLVAGRDFFGDKGLGRSVEDRFSRALEIWPDYQIAKLRLVQGDLRLNFAKNQRLPALDLQLSRSQSGLAYGRAEAQSITESGTYPEWLVGIYLEVPLFGNQKAQSQFQAQLTRNRQAISDLESLHSVLSNEIQSRYEQVDAAHEEVQLVTRDVALRKELLENERVRFEAGLGLLAQLLQRESDLSESQQRLVESNVRLGQAKAALMVADGSLLEVFDITLKD